MNPNYVLSILLAGVLLWLCLATRVEAPRVDYYRPAPAKPASYTVDCAEKQFVCKARKRMEKVRL